MMVIGVIQFILQLMPKRIIKRGTFILDVHKIVIEIYIMATTKDVPRKVIELSKKYGCDYFDISMDACGYTATFPTTHAGTFYIILSTEDLSVNTITHETDHVRSYILEYLGLTEGEESATLNGYINEKVFRFLHKNNLKIKID
jgi:hypothetical protein